MRLASTEGYSLELRVLGYQYPAEARAEYDSNWLNIEGHVGCPRGGWSFQDPCLLTYEVADLAAWFEAAALGNSSKSELSFIEPNLQFHLVPNSPGPNLRVYFELEARPPWAPSGTVGEAECFIEFRTAELDLRQAASSLREQLALFPQRAPR